MKKLKKFKEVIKRITNGDLEVGSKYFKYEGPRVLYTQLGVATSISNYETKARTKLYFVYGPYGRLEAVGLKANSDLLIPEDIFIAFEDLSGKQADKLYKKIEPLKLTMDKMCKEIYSEVCKSDTDNVSGTDIDKCKKLIRKLVLDGCDGGFYNTRNTVGDEMELLYRSKDITLEICREWEYFECFTSQEVFKKLKKYYNKQVKKQRYIKRYIL